ncbi:hypothetical protein JNB11_06765 [Kocuria palustris]|nr:hypothetical protein [Kocuria palustris]
MSDHKGKTLTSFTTGRVDTPTSATTPPPNGLGPCDIPLPPFLVVPTTTPTTFPVPPALPGAVCLQTPLLLSLTVAQGSCGEVRWQSPGVASTPSRGGDRPP